MAIHHTHSPTHFLILAHAINLSSAYLEWETGKQTHLILVPATIFFSVLYPKATCSDFAYCIHLSLLVKGTATQSCQQCNFRCSVQMLLCMCKGVHVCVCTCICQVILNSFLCLRMYAYEKLDTLHRKNRPRANIKLFPKQNVHFLCKKHGSTYLSLQAHFHKKTLS